MARRPFSRRQVEYIRTIAMMQGELDDIQRGEGLSHIVTIDRNGTKWNRGPRGERKPQKGKKP
jgi:hypothetical protein